MSEKADALFAGFVHRTGNIMFYLHTLCIPWMLKDMRTFFDIAKRKNVPQRNPKSKFIL